MCFMDVSHKCVAWKCLKDMSDECFHVCMTWMLPMYVSPGGVSRGGDSWIYPMGVILCVYMMDVCHVCILWMYPMDVCHGCAPCMCLMYVYHECMCLGDSFRCSSWMYFMDEPHGCTSCLCLMDVHHECKSGMYIMVVFAGVSHGCV